MKITICDDDALQLQIYTAQIEVLAEKHQIPIEVSTCKSGDELLFKLEDMKDYPDVLYLDIRMPGNLGIDTARQLRLLHIPSEIIFLTGYKEYMQDAFDVNAFHYIVKDEVTADKFEEIFLKVAERVEKKSQEVITFSCAGEARIVPLVDIRYFEVKNYVITVYYKEDSFEFYSTLGKIENALTGHDFLRIHRSFLVPTHVIREITRQGVVLMDGTELPVGRSYWEKIKKYIELKSSINN